MMAVKETTNNHSEIKFYIDAFFRERSLRPTTTTQQRTIQQRVTQQRVTQQRMAQQRTAQQGTSNILQQPTLVSI